MIPKHVRYKIEMYCAESFGKSDAIDAGEYGYTLAMEQMKPILDAARELISRPSIAGKGFQSQQVEYSVSKLSQLLKQYDNDGE